MHPQKGFAEVNDTRLYYEVAGSGYPLVLIHGFTLDTRMWDDQFSPLAQHYKVIRYDMRGFGKSGLPANESYTHSGDLMALLEHLRIKHVHILGLSLGGLVAIDFAKEYPETIGRLILADIVYIGEPPPAASALTDVLRTKAEEDGIDTAIETWLGLQIFAPALKNPRVASRLVQIVSDYSGYHWINHDPASIPDIPAVHRLEEINLTTLVLVGEHDLPESHATSDAICQRIPNARKLVLPSAGHMSNMETPELFNKLVLDFLSSLE